MAVPGHDELAYLTWRLVGRTAEGGKIMEVGVIGHSSRSAELTARVAGEIRIRNEHHRDRTVEFEILPTGADVSDPGAGRFFLDRPHRPLIVIWR